MYHAACKVEFQPFNRSYSQLTFFNFLKISLSVCLCMCVCVTFVVFTDCEGCTRPISTNPGSMEAGECGLTRGTCFAARRLELVAVAGRLWISWCVQGGADFFVFFFSIFHYFLRTHTACCKYEAPLPHIPLYSSLQVSMYVQGAII